jgi:uncharacterized protein YcfJ
MLIITTNYNFPESGSMSQDSRKMLILLSGFLGIAVITVLTAFAMKEIFQAPKEPVVQATQTPAPAAAPTAIVIDVKPHYVSTLSPKRNCQAVPHVEYVTDPNQASGAGAVIGGVTGGLLGSQAGGGRGKIVTSVAGAVLGAVAGDSVEKNMNSAKPHTVYSMQCSKSYTKTNVRKGYEVTYTYLDKQGMVVMDNPPVLGSVLPFPATNG